MNGIRLIYRRAFGRYLWLTNTVSSGVLLGLGDGIQQAIEFSKGVHAKETYDYRRTGRLFLVGLALGPPHHVFYKWLDEVYPKKNMKTIVKKILLDQTFAAPFFAVMFFMGAGLLEGRSFSEFWQEFKKKFLVVYMFDWCLWPPSQAINFYFLPPAYRVLYINCVTVVWDVFLSFMKHYDQVKERVIVKDE